MFEELQCTEHGERTGLEINKLQLNVFKVLSVLWNSSHISFLVHVAFIHYSASISLNPSLWIERKEKRKTKEI